MEMVASAIESENDLRETNDDLTECSTRSGSPASGKPSPSENSARSSTRYSTTSSVYAEHMLSNPNIDHILYCIGALMQAQIFEDESAALLRGEEFEVEIALASEYGGPLESIPEHILQHETLNDASLREKLLRGVVPTCDTIYRFLALLSSSACYSAQCNIIALIYLNRITSRNKIALTMKNWRGLWTSSVILAQKVWDDRPMKTSNFAQFLPGVSKEQLRALELRAFTLLDYNAQVKPSVYAKYYFELRALFCDMAGGDPRNHWSLRPLTIAESHRLDVRSSRAGQSLRELYHMNPLSLTASAKESIPRTFEDATYTRPSSRFVLPL